MMMVTLKEKKKERKEAEKTPPHATISGDHMAKSAPTLLYSSLS